MPNVDPTKRRIRTDIPAELRDNLALAAASLRAAEYVCVLTGAGISAESGIPTFRDALTGYWSNYSPEELASAAAFERDPTVVWDWYRERRQAIARAVPSVAHTALAHLPRFVSHCTVITQNVDDLHQRAGSPDVLSLHGSVNRIRCSAGCAGVTEVSIDDPMSAIPICPKCGALMRPDVVWFGEDLHADTLSAAQSAALASDVFLSIGTSNLVQPAASLPWLAARHGSTVIVINPVMTGQRTGANIIPIRGNAGVVVPWLLQNAFRGRKPRPRRQDEVGSQPAVTPAGDSGQNGNHTPTLQHATDTRVRQSAADTGGAAESV